MMTQTATGFRPWMALALGLPAAMVFGGVAICAQMNFGVLLLSVFA